MPRVPSPRLMGFWCMKRSVCRGSVIVALICVIGAAAPSPRAATLPQSAGFIGELQQYRVREKESLVEIARKFDLGFNEIAAANPGVDPFIPKAGSLITIPTAWILPAVSARPAIVVNIPELRLYYFGRKSSGKVSTFPLGIGDEGKDTPLGNYTVTQKIVHPAWYVPASIRATSPKLPKVVPPGPNNPMGSHALRLSRDGILIHGTHRPWGIGRRSSHGCLRLYPEDIVKLFKLVPEGMRVVIVNQPVKVGARGRKVFVEVHRYKHLESSVGQTLRMLAERKLLDRTDFAKVIRAMEEKRGVPVEVTLTP